MDAILGAEAWKEAELLVPGSVPLGALKLVVLPDDTALGRWQDRLRQDLPSELWPAIKIRADGPTGPRPHFPDWYQVENRPRVAPGSDQRVAAITMIDPRRVRGTDFAEVDDELSWDDDEDEPNDDEIDLYSLLYSDRGAFMSTLSEHPEDDLDDEHESGQ